MTQVSTNNNKSANKKSNKILTVILNIILAILLPVVGLLLTLLIGAPFTNTPLLMFFPVIGICAWKGGFKTGIVASVTSAFLILYFFYNPQNAINLYDPFLYLQFILIAIEGAFICQIIERTKSREKIALYKTRERELNKKLFEIQEQNVKYEKEIRSRDEFLSVASHELKTPLTSMLLQTQTALHNIRNVSVARFSFENLLNMLESVENQTKRLSKMINDLLAVSVITVGSLNLEYEEIDLGKLVKGVINDFQGRLEKEKVHVEFSSDEKVIGTWDKIRIEQAISNFLSNAIKYGDHKPITISVQKQNRYAEFSIIDQGIGISKQKQKIIFELFQRAVAPDQYKGLGVGLYITQKIVNAHGGSVEVFSKPGKGSTFTMKLPLKKPANITLREH